MNANGRGRPPVGISLEEVAQMRKLGFKWTEIATSLQVSISRMKTWRAEINYDDEYDELVQLDDGELDSIIRNFVADQPERGEKSCAGLLLSSGYKVTRQQLRDSIARVDEEGKKKRSQRKRKRIAYNIHYPHHLWHHDGWHKLKEWGIVVHGCIDGGTRLAIYVVAADNNRADTVLEIFKSACTRMNQLPSRLRGDQGTENRRVAEFMIQQRGMGRGSYITGPSQHNQRIESYWRFIRSHCLQFYRDLFRVMSRHGRLNCQIDSHRFVLVYLFLPLINLTLEEWLLAWNNHKIRTEQHKTPLQLVHMLRDSCPLPPAQVNEEYGVEEEEDGEKEEGGNRAVVFGSPYCALSEERIQEFRANVKPFTRNIAKVEYAPRYFHALEYYERLL